MNFGDFCNIVLDAASKKLQQKRDEFEEYREIYERSDDETLFRYLKSGGISVTRRMAISSILRDRGYGKNDSNSNEGGDF